MNVISIFIRIFSFFALGASTSVSLRSISDEQSTENYLDDWGGNRVLINGKSYEYAYLQYAYMLTECYKVTKYPYVKKYYSSYNPDTHTIGGGSIEVSTSGWMVPCLNIQKL